MPISKPISRFHHGDPGKKRRTRSGRNTGTKRARSSVKRAPLRKGRSRKGLRKQIRRGTVSVETPYSKTAAAVVTVMNEAETIGSVLSELNRLLLHEIIVVVNGSSDDTLERVKETVGGNGLVVHYPQPLGYDVGRAIGAKIARSEILLFLDGDFAVPAEQLVPFIAAIDRGADIALNDLSPFTGSFRARDSVSTLKEFLNRSVGRPDLGVNSMTAIPHAISRKALDEIGTSRLAVPPLAQAVAINRGLKIVLSASVNVYRKNRVRSHNSGLQNPVAKMIVGDHVEALKHLMADQGFRLSYRDTSRNRTSLQEEEA